MSGTTSKRVVITLDSQEDFSLEGKTNHEALEAVSSLLTAQASGMDVTKLQRAFISVQSSTFKKATMILKVLDGGDPTEASFIGFLGEVGIDFTSLQSTVNNHDWAVGAINIGNTPDTVNPQSALASHGFATGAIGTIAMTTRAIGDKYFLMGQVFEAVGTTDARAGTDGFYSIGADAAEAMKNLKMAINRNLTLQSIVYAVTDDDSGTPTVIYVTFIGWHPSSGKPVPDSMLQKTAGTGTATVTAWPFGETVDAADYGTSSLFAIVIEEPISPNVIRWQTAGPNADLQIVPACASFDNHSGQFYEGNDVSIFEWVPQETCSIQRQG